MSNQDHIARRRFLKSCALFSCGLAVTTPATAFGTDSPLTAESPNVLGPRAGFSPQIGTLVSMLTWMRSAILAPVQGLTVKQLDYLHDAKANTIGALLLHLAATERHYQLHTFGGVKWGDWDEETNRKFGAAGALGEAARKTIKGNELAHYLGILAELRAQTVTELAKRDDAWLSRVDRDWGWGPTNNLCKWFHVCEHESHHNGQVTWIKARLPDPQSGDPG